MNDGREREWKGQLRNINQTQPNTSMNTIEQRMLAVVYRITKQHEAGYRAEHTTRATRKQTSYETVPQRRHGDVWSKETVFAEPGSFLQQENKQ